jgi:hypothetical protein
MFASHIFFTVSGACLVRLGNTASRQWIRARDKRPRHTVLRSVPVCICRYVVLPVNQKQVHDNDAFKTSQMLIPKKSIPRSSLPLSSTQSRPIRSGVFRVCSMVSKTTTSLRSRVSSAALSAWRNSSRASMHRFLNTSLHKASSLCNLHSDG